jgi:hypothetical protein
VVEEGRGTRLSERVIFDESLADDLGVAESGRASIVWDLGWSLGPLGATLLFTLIVC